MFWLDERLGNFASYDVQSRFGDIECSSKEPLIWRAFFGFWLQELLFLAHQLVSCGSKSPNARFRGESISGSVPAGLVRQILDTLIPCHGKCGGSLRAVRQAPGIDAAVQLRPEMPPIPLPRPVHLQIADVASVSDRRQRRDDGGVNDTAFLQRPLPPFGQVIPDFLNGRRDSPWCSTWRRKLGSSSRPEPSPTSPRQSAERSRHRRASSSPPDRSDCRTAARSARAASPIAAVVPCRYPWDRPAQCGPSRCA